jgi:electron transfer flavoprotein beta subunit
VRIAVCIKHVPDSTAPRRIDLATKRLDRSGSGAPNPTDMNALEEALRIREAAGGEVFAVTMGPAEAMESLRKALAMGADRAVLVTDDAAAGSDLLGTTRVLAAVIGREAEPVDLVLTGQQAGDSDGAVLWAALAERLERPVISQVAELTVADGAVTGKRQTELGYEVIRAPLPAVIAVSDAINEPRYPSLKGIMGAKKKPTDRLSLSDLGMDAGEVGEAGSRTAVTALGEPPSRGDRVIVEDEDGSGAQKILEFLVERRLV